MNWQELWLSLTLDGVVSPHVSTFHVKRKAYNCLKQLELKRYIVGKSILKLADRCETKASILRALYAKLQHHRLSQNPFKQR